MDNVQLLKKLEQQRDVLFQQLSQTTISGLYKKEYADVKGGRIFVLDNEERQMLRDLERLSKDTSLDLAYKAKLLEYSNLDNEALVEYFQGEFRRVFTEMIDSGKSHEIQALFIEYDDYYQFTSYIICYGRQEYPLVEEPRYITDEYDYNKQVLHIDNGIDFMPAWLSCEELDLEYLEVNAGLEQLFILHSRTLLHRALDRLNNNGELAFLSARPFTFYINEHDCEVMTLYLIS